METPHGTPGRLRTIAATALAQLAFAGNSLLTRQALQPHAIDPASFSTLRLLAGAITLVLLSRMAKQSPVRRGGSWLPALVLFVYAFPFSFAYTTLSAGTGALILFGAVQITMVAGALRSGERPLPLQWLGLILAVGGLVYLVLPGVSAPPPLSAAAMALAGTMWGVYSLLGRGASSPLAQTSDAFFRAVPFALVLSAVLVSRASATAEGVLLAVTCGAVTSACGYVIWYQAVRGLTATRAAVVQSAAPILAAVGGVLFLGESVTTRLVVSSVVVLGGLALTVAGKERVARQPSAS